MSRDYVLQPFGSAIKLQIDYEHELNSQQFAAVTASPGPALVIAGAGAGKTRTLVYRVAFLIEQGIPADRILLLTFTNKAAKEMMRRVADLLGADISSLWGGTFHSVGNRLLRRHADRLGYPANFTILDREDSKDLIGSCLKETGIDLKATQFPKADLLGDIISLAINKQQTIPELLEEQFDYFSQLGSEIEDVHQRYVRRKRATGVMDFDDLLSLWLGLLRGQADLCEQYQRRFQFILVDEYQDTNKLQSDLIDLLGGRHRNVMVVGDDAQSIYSWRGANFRNIIEFPRRYPEAQLYKIETNYRSTPEILAFANAAIALNQNQFEKNLTASRKPGVKPAIIPCNDAGQQAGMIAQRVLELREQGVTLNNIAVLYRSHFHALELQLELTRRNIPFSITSGIRFFEQAHIKDVTGFLKVVSNPLDETAFKRLVRLLPGIGGRGADKLWTAFQAGAANPAPPSPASDSNTEGQRPPDAGLLACRPAVPKKAASGWDQFTATVSQIQAKPNCRSPAKMIRMILEGCYDNYLKEHFTNYRSRREDLDQLANFAQQFDGPEEFLSQLALLTNLEAEEGQPAGRDTEQLRLSTIHQAKGLEFAVVFVIMLCEGLFPSARSLENASSEEEERRLFYVAITRAQNELYLTYPLMRFSYSQGTAFQQPSRFLNEIPADLHEQWNLR